MVCCCDDILILWSGQFVYFSSIICKLSSTDQKVMGQFYLMLSRCPRIVLFCMIIVCKDGCAFTSALFHKLFLGSTFQLKNGIVITYTVEHVVYPVNKMYLKHSVYCNDL